MQEIIDRMKRCGIPEKTAVCLYLDFVRNDKYAALLAYIRAEEKEHGVEGIQQ